ECQAAGERGREVQAGAVVELVCRAPVIVAEDVLIVVIVSGTGVLDLAVTGPPVAGQLHPAVLHIAEPLVASVPGMAGVVRPRYDLGPLREGRRVVDVIEGEIQVEGVLPWSHLGREEPAGRHPSLRLAFAGRDDSIAAAVMLLPVGVEGGDDLTA